MEVESSTYTDFISCDRAGRRNAVHDIQRDATTISMRKLTKDLGDLAVEGAGELLQTPKAKEMPLLLRTTLEQDQRGKKTAPPHDSVQGVGWAGGGPCCEH
ncbi:cAMP-dependent protein kinase inhibitor gamma isoform X1 [Falco naumanni]|nr:cAMP-dependent protein kinase inhibitor gamma isoform X1 [Falco naumanni]XP_040464493.1 cAMP-dependent protein kinase inhibitor gamma isoform X1 [Falco naumanni]